MQKAPGLSMMERGSGIELLRCRNLQKYSVPSGDGFRKLVLTRWRL